MLPEQRKIIMENQKLLYSFRKRGTDLPEKALTLLSKKIDKAYKTMQKSIDELKQHNIILDSNDERLNQNIIVEDNYIDEINPNDTSSFIYTILGFIFPEG